MTAWTTQEEYERLHGTQKAQAAAQVRTKSAVDGPWRLERWGGYGIVLPNSVRSTRAEAERLQMEEFLRTGKSWQIVKYERGA